MARNLQQVRNQVGFGPICLHIRQTSIEFDWWGEKIRFQRTRNAAKREQQTPTAAFFKPCNSTFGV